MKVLIVGGGGREHAIAAALAKSPGVSKLYCAPGNAGIAELAELVPIKATDTAAMVKFAHDNEIELTVVAPDDPLAAGMVDALEQAGLRAFGPTKAAAQIEASKAFSKDLMRKYNIPTAPYHTFDDSEEALRYLTNASFPLYIKTDGLALGKGAVYAADYAQAAEIVREMMCDKVFGDSGSRVVVEEMLYGIECTCLAFTDGTTVKPLVSARDFKKAYDGDKGLNTGGMGAIAPFGAYSAEIAEYCMQRIYLPTINAMKAEGRPFKGVLYFGLMLHPETGTASVIEYNCRFGDPEAQVVLTLLDTDLLEIFQAIIEERLSEIEIRWKPGGAAIVIAASGGYPEGYETGKVITGLNTLDSDVAAYHAGTQQQDDSVVSAGGRVLGICASGGNVAEALDKVYANIKRISFEGMRYRGDIGVVEK